MKEFLSKPFMRQILRILIAIGGSLLIGFIITLIVSKEPFKAYKMFLTGPLTKFNRFGDWIEESITLILIGLAVAIAFKANMFSLGAEGQLLLGALSSGVIALFVPLPAILRIPLALLVSMLSGFLWGWIPGFLKAKLNANEIVSTLMLNAIALKIYDYILISFLRPPDAGYNASDFFSKEGILQSFIPNMPFLQSIHKLFSDQTNISIMVYILIASVIVVYYLMFKTPFGYELRMIGNNIKFARYGGINTEKTVTLIFAISGIFAGLAGAHLALGIHTKVIMNISLGVGFEGIVVAILARNNPLLIPFTGLAYGYLRAGADVMERASDMSREMVYIIQAIIILFVTAERLLPMIRRRISLRKESNTENSSASEGGAHAN